MDVTPDGSSKIAVWKGRAQVGNSGAGVVKSGREATVIDNQLAIAKFDRDDKDSLETWSKTRAKELARISSKLKGQDLRTSLMQSYLGNRWNMYNSFGLWVYDYAFGSYCFLPFGQGWSSPYGYGFGRSIWHYNLPWTVYYPPSNPTSTGGGSSQPSTTPIVSARDRNGSVPPFERMQRSGRGFDDARNAPVERNTNSTPVYTPPIIVSAPPTGNSSSKSKP